MWSYIVNLQRHKEKCFQFSTVAVQNSYVHKFVACETLPSWGSLSVPAKQIWKQVDSEFKEIKPRGLLHLPVLFQGARVESIRSTQEMSSEKTTSPALLICFVLRVLVCRESEDNYSFSVLIKAHHLPAWNPGLKHLQDFFSFLFFCSPDKVSNTCTVGHLILSLLQRRIIPQQT